MKHVQVMGLHDILSDNAGRSELAGPTAWYGVGCSSISTITAKREKNLAPRVVFTLPKMIGVLPFLVGLMEEIQRAKGKRREDQRGK